MVYLDNAATTAMRPEVLEAMLPYFTQYYANASGKYDFAGCAKAAIRKSRQIIADALCAKAECIYFTSGGSESDNWAILSAAKSTASKGRHIITTKIEHHAVLNTCKYLEREGWSVTYLPVDSEGFVDPLVLERAIRKDTVLISVMLANNEVGTIEPVAKIGQIAHEHGILFHTDAVQAFGHIDIDVNQMNIDLLSASAHKLGGPKGIGFLYASKHAGLEPMIRGGAQENARRAGTENVAGIAGFAKATQLAVSELSAGQMRLGELRDYLVDTLVSKVPYVSVNGPKDNRLSANASLSFGYVDGETLAIMLGTKGVCVSTGAACASSADGPSHVLTAMGADKDVIKGSIRLTLGPDTTREDIDFAVSCISETVESLRADNPRYPEK